jgi:RNA polymerase sigma-54 factor
MSSYRQTLGTKQTQNMALKPKMLQSLKLLTMPLMELETQIKVEMMQNPMLEIEDYENDDSASNEDLEEKSAAEKAEEEQKEKDELQKTLEETEQLSEILDSYNEMYRESSGRQVKHERVEMEDYVPQHENKKADFYAQIDELDLTENEYDFAYDLIDSCNIYGILESETIFDELLEDYQLPAQRAEEIHQEILHFDPAGITARNIQECLLAQIEATSLNRLLIDLIHDDFDDLIHKRYSKLAKKYHVTEQNILYWKEQISHLDPKPGLRVINNEDKYIVPDVIIKNIDGKYEVTINDFSFPRIRLSRRYKKILERVKDKKESLAYVRDKVNSARFLIKSIYMRGRTLERVTEAIIRNQIDFFYNENGVLNPLTYSVIAEELQVNESTISRVVRSKYADTPFGILCLKDFFTSKAGKNRDFEAVSRQNVEKQIFSLIEQEDKSNPLSDSEISDLMGKNGTTVSRRLVAKYRNANGILNSHLRKK